MMSYFTNVHKLIRDKFQYRKIYMHRWQWDKDITEKIIMTVKVKLSY